MNTVIGMLSAFAMIIALLARPIIWICYLLFSAGIGHLVFKFLTSKGVARNKSLSISALIIAIIIIIPFGDYLQTRNKLKQLNSSKGGLKVYCVISGVEGVHGLENAVDFGYNYGEIFEGKEPQKYLVRLFKNPKEIQRQKGLYNRQRVNEFATYGIRSSRQQIEGIIFKRVNETYAVSTGEILGQYVTYYTNPSYKGISLNSFRPWMEMNLGDGGFSDMKLLLGKTLIPAQISDYTIP
jgi:hypothetical protein